MDALIAFQPYNDGTTKVDTDKFLHPNLKIEEN
jgi:hypothetical protein